MSNALRSFLSQTPTTACPACKAPVTPVQRSTYTLSNCLSCGSMTYTPHKPTDATNPAN